MDSQTASSNGLVCDASSKVITERINTFFMPDCTDAALFPAKKCSSDRTETCDGDGAAVVPVPLPEAALVGKDAGAVVAQRAQHVQNYARVNEDNEAKTRP